MKIPAYNKFFILLLLGLSSVCLYAQTTTGIWKGTLYDDTTKIYHPCEIVITEKNGFVNGYSYVTHYHDGKSVVLLKKIKLVFRGNNLAFEDMAIISGDSSLPDTKKTKLSFATAITGSGVALAMNGIWKTAKSNTGKKRTGTLSLSKVDDFTEAEVFTQLQNLDLASNLSFVRKRQRPQDIDLKEIDIASVSEAPASSDELKQETENKIAAKSSPVVAIKEAAAIIKEEDKPVVVVIEKKEEPVPPPIEEKLSVAVAKPAEVKKIPTPQPVVSKPVEVKKVSPPPVAVKQVEVKKLPPPIVVKKEPVPVVKQPVAPPPAPVIAAVKKPEPPPQPVVKKELPVQVFVAPAKDVATDITNRKTTTQQSVEYQSDSLILTLYDNGEIDGDTVSVLMNGKVIFSKAGLSIKPNRKTIYITPDMDSLTLVMYAENLGSIPPNTGLLVVGDGDLVYELRFKADLNTNAAIIFRRKIK